MMKTPDEQKASELGTSSYVSGVEQPIEDLRTQYVGLSSLYQIDAATNSTRKNELYTKMGLAPYQTLPQAVTIPKGFEIDYKLVQHEEDVRFKYNQYLQGNMGYDTFLYEAYGRDILKTQGHDLKNPMYWYSQRQKGVTDSPIDNPVILKNLINQAEDLFKLEEFYSRVAMPLSDTRLAGTFLDSTTMADLFSDQETLVEQLGSWEKVLTSYKAGTLLEFNPLVDANGDGEYDYYLHTTGKLYQLTEDDELARSSSYAKIVRRADGTIDRISTTGSDIADFAQEVWTGFINGVSSIVDLGGMVFAAGSALVTGENYGDQYNNYLAWRNAWAPESAVYQLDNQGADNWIFGFGNAAGTITGFLAMMFVTQGLGSIGAASKVTTTAGAVATKTSALAKFGKTILSIPKYMANMQAGIPLSKTAIGFGNVIQRAAINFAVDGAEMWSHGKARQAQTGLSDEQLVLRAVGVSAFNSLLTVGLNGGTDDIGALTRVALVGKKRAIAKGSIKQIDDVLTSTALGRWALTHPRLLFTGNVLADTVENVVTMGLRTNFYSTGGDIKPGEAMRNMLNPQMLFMAAFGTYSGAKGFMGNEGMRTYGAIRTSEQVGDTYATVRNNLETRLIEAQRDNTRAAEAASIQTIISKMDSDYKAKTTETGENKIPVVAMLEILEDIHLRNLDGTTDKAGNPQSFVTDIFKDAAGRDIKHEELFLQRTIVRLFEQRANLKRQKYSELVRARKTPNFAERLLDSIPIIANKKIDGYERLFNQVANKAAIKFAVETLGSGFREDIEYIPGGRQAKESADKVVALAEELQQKDFVQVIPYQDIMGKAIEEADSPEVKQAKTLLEQARKELLDAGYTEEQVLAMLTDGTIIHYKNFNPNGGDAAEQKMLQQFLQALDIADQVGIDKGYPHRVKIGGEGNERYYLMIGQMDMAQIKRDIMLNKVIDAGYVLLKSNDPAELQAALTVLGASKLSIAEDSEVPILAKVEVLNEIAKLNNIPMEKLSRIILADPALKFYYSNNKELFPDSSYVKYALSIMAIDKLKDYESKLVNVGKQKNIVSEYGKTLKELESYGMIEQLKANNALTEAQFQKIQEQLKLNFPQLLSSLKEAQTLLRSSSQDRNFEKVVKYLVDKFSPENNLDIIKTIEDEVNARATTEQLILEELRQSLGDTEFENIVRTLLDSEVIREKANAGQEITLNDFENSLRQQGYNKTDIGNIKKRIIQSRETVESRFIKQFIDEGSDINDLLLELGLFRKVKDGLVPVEKLYGYNELIAKLEASANPQAKKILENIRANKSNTDINSDSSDDEIRFKLFNRLIPTNLEFIPKDSRVEYFGLLIESLTLYDLNIERRNIAVNVLNKLMSDDTTLDLFLRTLTNQKAKLKEILGDGFESVDGDIVSNFKYKLENLFKRVLNLNGIKFDSNNLNIELPFIKEVMFNINNRLNNPENIDYESELRNFKDSVQTETKLSYQEEYEQSITLRKNSLLTRDELISVFGSDESVSKLLNIYNQMTVDRAFEISKPADLLTFVIENKLLEAKKTEEFVTASKERKLQILKSEILKEFKGSINESIIVDALNNYLRDPEGAGSFYEYTNLKHIKSQTAAELERFTEEYVKFNFDDTEAVELDDTIVRLNLAELRTKEIAEIMLQLSYANKEVFTEAEVRSIAKELGYNDYMVAKHLMFRNQLLKNKVNESPIIEFNLRTQGELLNRVLESFGYSLTDLKKNNFKNIPGVNTLQPQTRGIKLEGEPLKADVLKLITDETFSKVIDEGRQIFNAFGNVVLLKEDTIINPKEIIGSYVVPGDDPEFYTGFVNLMTDAFLKKLGKAGGSAVDTQRLSQVIQGLNVKGQVDDDLKNFMMIESLYGLLENYIGDAKSITDLFPDALKLTNEEADRVRRHGWILQQDATDKEIYTLVGYEKPKTFSFKANEKILLNEILPSNFELNEEKVHTILTKGPTYDPVNTTVAKPSDIAFMKQEYSGEFDVLERIRNKQFEIVFNRELNNDGVTFKKSLSVKDAIAELEKQPNSSRAIMLLNKIQMALKISEGIEAELDKLEVENVDLKKVYRLMQDTRIINSLVDRIKNRNVKSDAAAIALEVTNDIRKLRAIEDNRGELTYNSNRGYASSRTYADATMTGADFMSLNARYIDYKNADLNADELNYIVDRMKSIFTDFKSDQLIDVSNNGLNSIINEFIFRDSKGDYHLGVGAAEALFMRDADEVNAELERILGKNSNAYQVMQRKMQQLREMYPNALRQIGRVEITQEKFSTTTAGKKLDASSRTTETPEQALDAKRSLDENRKRSDDLYNSRNKFIKANIANNKLTDEYGSFFRNFTDAQSNLVSTKVSDPGRSMVLNMKNELAVGESIKQIDDIAQTIRENGVIAPFGKAISDDAIYDLATEIYFLSSNNLRQSEYIKYLIVSAEETGYKKVTDVNGEVIDDPQGRTEIKKFYASYMENNREESLIDLYRVMRSLDPSKEYTVFVLDRSDYSAGGKTADEGSNLKVISFKDYDKTNLDTYGNQLFRKMTIEALRIGKDLSNNRSEVLGQAEEFINLALSRKMSKRAIIETFKNNLIKNSGFTEDQANALFYAFTDTDVTSKYRSLNEEAAFQTLKVDLEQELYDKKQNTFAKRVVTIAKTGINIDEYDDAGNFKRNIFSQKYDHADQAYVDGLLKGEKVNIILNDTPEDIQRFGDIIYNWMASGDDMEAVRFIAKQAHDETLTLSSLAQRRKNIVKDLDYNGRNLGSFANYKKVYVDLETITANRGTDAEEYPFQIGLVYEKNGAIVRRENIKISVDNYQDIISKPEYSSFKSFLNSNPNLETVLKNKKNEIKSTDASQKVLDFIESARQDTQAVDPRYQNEVLIVAHNGKEADFKWMKQLFNASNQLMEFANLEKDFVDTFEIINKFPIVGFNDNTSINTIKRSMSALAQIPHLSKEIENFAKKEGFDFRVEQHNASVDAAVLSIVGRHLFNEENFISMDTVYTGLINKISKIAKDLNMNLSQDRLYEVIDEISNKVKFNIEQDDFTRKINDTPELTNVQFKNMIDSIQQYTLEIDNIYSRSGILGDFGRQLAETNELRSQLRNGGNTRLNRLFTYIYQNFNNALPLKEDMTYDEEVSFLTIFTKNIFEKIRNDYGDINEMGKGKINNDFVDRIIIQALKDNDGMQKLFNVLNSRIDPQTLAKEFSLEGFNTFTPSITVGKVFEALKNNTESVLNKNISDSVFTQVGNDLSNSVKRLEDIIGKLKDTKDGAFKNALIEEAVTLFNDNYEILKQGPEAIKAVNDRLNSKEYKNNFANFLINEFKSGSPIAQLSMKRYWGLVTSLSKTEITDEGVRYYPLTNKEGKIEELRDIPVGSIVINNSLFQKIFGVDETTYRKNLKLDEGSPLYLTTVRYPADKIDPLYGYKVVVDYGDTSSDFIRMNALDIQRHSGDFDGDKVALIKPTIESQTYYSKGMLELMNQPYEKLNTLIQQLRPESFYDKAKEKYILRTHISHKLAPLIEADLEALNNKTTTYQKRLSERTQTVEAMYLNDPSVKKLFDDAGYEQKDIAAVVKESYIEEADLSFLRQGEKGYISNNVYFDSDAYIRKLQYIQQKLAFPIINFKDSVTGYIQKLQGATTDVGAYYRGVEFSADKLEYRHIVIPSFMRDAIKSEIATDPNKVKNILKGILSEQVYNQLNFEESVSIEKVRAAFILEEANIRLSQDFEGRLTEGLKVQVDNTSIRDRMEKTIKLFNEVTNGILDDGFISYGNSYNDIVSRIFNKMGDEASRDRTEVVSEKQMMDMVNKKDVFIIVDKDMTEEKGTAILRKEYAENNPVYRTVSYDEGTIKNASKDKAYVGTYNGKDYFTYQDNLGTNIKFASIGNEALFKSTVANVVDREIINPSVNGETIDSRNIAMYVSQDVFNQAKGKISDADFVRIKTVDADGNEIEVDAFRTNLSVVENTKAFPDYIKETPMDMLIFSHSKNTAINPVMFGDVDYKWNPDTNKYEIDQSISLEMNRIREQMNEPLLLANDGTSLYYKLLLNSTISNILDNVKMPDKERKELTNVLAAHQVNGSYKNPGIIPYVLKLINKYFKSDDTSTSLEKFHKLLNQTERKLFSQELFYKIHPTVFTGVKEYNEMVSKLKRNSPEGLIASKSANLSIVKEKGEGLLEMPGYYTSDMLTDTSDGVISKPGYIAMTELLNYFSKEDGYRISSTDAKVLYKEGLLDRGISLPGRQESGFQNTNMADVQNVRNSFEDPRSFGIKAGTGNTNPGVPIIFSTGALDFSNRQDFKSNVADNFVKYNDRLHPQQSRFLKFYSKQTYDKVLPSTVGTSLNRLSIAMKDYDNEIDRVQDMDIRNPKNIIAYKNPTGIVFKDDGEVEFNYMLGNKVEGSLGKVFKEVVEKGNTSFGYNLKKQIDVNDRVQKFEDEVFRTLDFTDNKDVTPDFIVELADKVELNHKQEIMQDETIPNEIYRSQHTPLDGDIIKMKKDILATSGIGGTTAYDIKLQDAITRLGRDQRFTYAELMSPASLLKSLAKNADDAFNLNRYMELKRMYYLLKEAGNEETMRETILLDLKDRFKIDTEKQLVDDIKSYSDSHRKEAYLANLLVNKIKDMGDEVAKETGQPSPKLFHILAPMINVNTSKNKGDYIMTLKTMFGINENFKDESIDKYLGNTKYDFLQSVDLVANSVAKIRAAKNLSNNLKENGSLINARLIQESQSILEKEMALIVDRPEQKKYRIQLVQHIETAMRRKFNVDTLKDNMLYSLYTELKNFKNELLDGEDIKYSTMDELQVLADKNPDNVTIKELLDVEKYIEDVKYEALLENPDIQKRILERVRTIAKANEASLVNEYGQFFPQSNSDGFYKPIANFDTSFLVRNLNFAQSGESYEQRLALAAVTGRLYMMDQGTAEHLDKHFYTSKVPGKVMQLLSNISNYSTKFIMSSLPQLANRMFNFSMFDYGIMASVAPTMVTKIPRALREFSALLQSNGKILNTKEYADLTGFIKTVGLDPTKGQGLDIVLMQEKVNLPKFTNGYFNFTDKALQAQTLATRYALYLEVKESFEKGKPIYGGAYFKKEGIDALKSNEAKAMYVVDETLGSPGAFPFAAKYTQGWAMFATFPLALIRYGVNNTRTIGRVMKEIYMGEMDNGGYKQLVRSAVGLTGVAMLTNLMVSLVSELFNVDEETEEEWKKDQVLFKPLQMILFGKPYVQYGQSANPLQSLEEMFVEPFTAEDNDTLGKKLLGLINTNILGKLNPLFKIPAEVLTNKDFFGPTPIDNRYSPEDNLARKFAGYIVGIGGANAMVDSWRYSRLDTEDPTFVERLGTSMIAAIQGELGNNKGYKAELKNYYNAMSIVNGYRAIENKEIYGDQLNSSGFDSDISFALASDIRKAMNSEQRPSVIYGLINESIQNGAGKNEILYALRSNSILGRLAQVRNKNDFYAGLTDKERVILDDAIQHEQQNYSILRELLQDTSQSNYGNRYVRNYIPRNYPSYPRDPRYIYNQRYYPPRTPYKPKRQLQAIQKRNMFVPRLSDDTGSRAQGINKKLRLVRPQQKRIYNTGTTIRTRAQQTPKVIDHRKAYKE